MSRQALKHLCRVLFVMCFATGAVSWAVPAFSPDEGTTGKSFPMRYDTGTEASLRDAKVKVTVGRESIVCERKGRVLFSIPVGSVEEIAYDTISRRRSRGMFSPLMEEDGWLYVLPFMIAVAPFAHAMKTTQHFVHISWQEGDAWKIAAFKVGKGEYADFLAELEVVTGKPWKDRVKERLNLREELQKISRIFSLALNQRVWVAGVWLQSGPYQVMLVERNSARGELYFFTGKVAGPASLKAASVVRLVNRTSDVSSPEVSYKDDGGTQQIAEIRLADKTVRLP